MSNCYTANCSTFQILGSDQQIKYTGPTVSSLGICNGDTLGNVDNIIIQTLQNFSTGIGISLPNLNLTGGDCAPLFATCVTCCGTCTDLACIMNCYYNAICTLYTDVTTLQTQVASIDGPYNTLCLSNVTSASSFNSIFQELLTEYCALVSAFNVLNTTVGGFTTGINTTIGNFLSNAITTCSGNQNVQKTGSGASLQIQFQGFVPVGAIIPYAGPLTNFSGGVGNSGTNMCGWNIANGLNGTANMMGQVPVGLTNMGGTLPTNATGLIINTYGTQGGEVKHTLLAAELPTAGINTTVNEGGGHDHSIFYKASTAGSGTSNQVACFNDNGSLGDNTPAANPFVAGTGPGSSSGSGSVGPRSTAFVSRSTTGITVTGSLAGGNQAHNNMQPYTGVIYIQRMF